MKKTLIALSFTLLLGSCSQRILDFTTVSTKNNQLNFTCPPLEVKGTSFGFLGIGASIKDATDNALKSAGQGYDVLQNGVIKVTQYPFVIGYTVTGTAVKSSTVKPVQ